MKLLFVTAILLLAPGGGSFASGFRIGIFCDDLRETTCVTGSAGDTFEQVAWAFIPDDLGLAYVTYRFAFPDNVDFTRRPVFHEQVTSVVFTEFTDGTSEWNMMFTGCPSGWVRVFTQDCVLLDDRPSRIGILGDRSMIRDCPFVLHEVTVLNEIEVNQPDCGTVSATTTTWSRLKTVFR